MIRVEQIDNLKQLLQDIIIQVVQDNDGTVTFRKNDGSTITFATGILPANNDNTIIESTTTLVGNTGEPGMSAYEIAQEYGYTGSISEWRESLKGQQGLKGKDSIKPRDGKEGITPELEQDITVRVSQTPSINMSKRANGKYRLQFNLPGSIKSQNGNDGLSTTLNNVEISQGNAEACLQYNNRIGTIKLRIPKGNKGNRGASALCVNGSSPSLENVIVDRILADGSTSWKCEGGLQEGANIYKFQLSKAQIGTINHTFFVGPKGISNGKIEPIAITQDINEIDYFCKDEYCTFGYLNVNNKHGIMSVFKNRKDKVVQSANTDNSYNKNFIKLIR